MITGVIGVGQDITELRQKQAALNHASKMETVGQLTGGIAHDFNNLLSVIDGNLRFLQQDVGNVSDDIAELFDDAMSAAADAAELTARLLAFSRNRGLKPELKDANEAVHNFSRFLSRTLGKANELQTELSEEALYINGRYRTIRKCPTQSCDKRQRRHGRRRQYYYYDLNGTTVRSRADLKGDNQAGSFA